MSVSPPWTTAHDVQLRRMRIEGVNWPEIARILGRSRWAVMVRAREIGARRPPPVIDEVPAQPPPERDPLPAGHPESWNALTAGTLLEGTAYPLPFFFR
jgi:hypothetical protein